MSIVGDCYATINSKKTLELSIINGEDQTQYNVSTQLTKLRLIGNKMAPIHTTIIDDKIVNELMLRRDVIAITCDDTWLTQGKVKNRDLPRSAGYLIKPEISAKVTHVRRCGDHDIVYASTHDGIYTAEIHKSLSTWDVVEFSDDGVFNIDGNKYDGHPGTSDDYQYMRHRLMSYLFGMPNKYNSITQSTTFL